MKQINLISWLMKCVLKCEIYYVKPYNELLYMLNDFNISIQTILICCRRTSCI